jgi:uncharacterized protein YuzE
MTLERHAFRIHGVTPPTVEWDLESDALYIRFSRRAVARTIDQNAEKMTITVDVDASGHVVGIEAVGVTHFTLKHILDAARVDAGKVDLSAAKFVSTKAVAA